jgi:hypothetical protein
MSTRSFRAVLQSADVSAGAAIPLFDAGNATKQLSVGANDQVVVTSGYMATPSAAGDVHVFFGTSATPAGGGATIMRNTTQGATAPMTVPAPVHGPKGNALWCKAAVAGVLNVVLTGYIRYGTP